MKKSLGLWFLLSFLVVGAVAAYYFRNYLGSVSPIAQMVVNPSEKESNTSNISDERLYRNINELKEFSEYTGGNGVLIDDFYGLAGYRHTRIKNTELIVFEKLHRFGDMAKYSIVDTLFINNIPVRHSVAFGCRLNGQSDYELIILRENEENVEYYNKIKKAWRADRKLKKIHEVDTKGIDCPNEGYE